MDCYCIKQTALPHTTRLFADFLYRFDRVRPFYSFDPFDSQSFAAAARSLRYPDERRAAVAEVLTEQARRFGAGEATRRNLERFRRGAAALVTGQQVGLLGGPLFSVYKALTAVRLADWLTSQGFDCVPVFWLATEDHDLAEVDHAFLLGRDYSFHRLEDSGDAHVAGTPVGNVRLSAAITGALQKAIASLPQTDSSKLIARTMLDNYRPGVTFGDAFGRFMASLLPSQGIIPLDPMHPQLRRLSAPVMRRAVESSGKLQQALAERNKELIRAGYHAQVHVSDGSTLFFVNHGGKRTAVRRRDSEFVVGDQRIAPDAMLDWLERSPDDFSPNVLLRPVVQDVLLPTVCYVGGPAEAAYMAQASVLFDRLVGRMPVIFPRASFTLLDARTDALLKRYSITVLDVISGAQKLREKMAASFLSGDLAEAFAGYERTLNQLLRDLRARMEGVDRSLADAAATSARKIAYQLAKIKRKAGRIDGRKSGQLEADADLLENMIHPRKSLQERVYSVASFFAMFGPALFDRVYERISPLTRDHQVLTL